MPKIKAFTGYLVHPDHAAAVVSPAYDTVSPEQRRRFAATHPHNFLNTMLLSEDFPPDSRPSNEKLLATNKSQLDALLSNGSFEQINRPSLFIYQLDSGEHVQTGVVCEIGVTEYEQKKLRGHENTQRIKEQLLTQYQQIVGVSSSPICLAYEHHAGIQQYLEQAVQAAPGLDFLSENGVRQRIWRIGPAHQQHLIDLFAPIETTYLTDGHHRAAAAEHYAKAMRAKHTNHGDEPYNQLLVVLFSAQQLKLLPFHRCVKDLNDLTEAQLLTAVRARFQTTDLGAIDMYTPEQPGDFGMLLNDRWYRLRVKAELVEGVNPIDALDVSILQNHILDPILGIEDSRSDPRMDYIAGTTGGRHLREKYTDGWPICFICYPTSIKQLMAIADAGQLMPPKSTYFVPKPYAGVFVCRK